jgi:hypothetical protein
MLSKLSQKLRQTGTKIHSFTLGTTLALFAVLLSQAGQSCAISGQ